MKAGPQPVIAVAASMSRSSTGHELSEQPEEVEQVTLRAGVERRAGGVAERSLRAPRRRRWA